MLWDLGLLIATNTKVSKLFERSIIFEKTNCWLLVVNNSQYKLRAEAHRMVGQAGQASTPSLCSDVTGIQSQFCGSGIRAAECVNPRICAKTR